MLGQHMPSDFIQIGRHEPVLRVISSVSTLEKETRERERQTSCLEESVEEVSTGLCKPGEDLQFNYHGPCVAASGKSPVKLLRGLIVIISPHLCTHTHTRQRSLQAVKTDTNECFISTNQDMASGVLKEQCMHIATCPGCIRTRN